MNMTLVAGASSAHGTAAGGRTAGQGLQAPHALVEAEVALATSPNHFWSEIIAQSLFLCCLFLVVKPSPLGFRNPSVT